MNLSSLERLILEALQNKSLKYEEIKFETGLKENICFNVLQALIIRGLIATDGIHYTIQTSIPKEVLQAVNGVESKKYEALELIEAVIEQEKELFKIKRVGLLEKDYKIFLALLSNLESFLNDAHKAAQREVPLKDRQVVFWGSSDMQAIINQMTTR